MIVQQITRETAGDLNLQNEPFSMPGQMAPELRGGVWSYRIRPYEEPEIMTFPQETYDFDRISVDGAAFGAYENGKCVGLVILKNGFFRYMYVTDLKVSAAARNKGVGRALIEAATQEALKRGYRGLFLQAQDNNLNACLFYLRLGFEIGGYDNRVYDGTSQQGKGDILFYLTAAE